jgi:predicted ArsR family transcriptional regulator
MKRTNLDKRFFASTRGRIVTLLRGATRTVNELAEKLGVTDNAVRAQLISLERDGLVQQSGVQRSHRKPQVTYDLTPEAEQLFPKSYDAVLNQLITALKGRFAPEAVNEVLREVGASMAANQASDQHNGDLEHRAKIAMKILEVLGGAPRIERDDGKLSIRSSNCPLGAAVAEHPEVCQLAEALVAEIMGVKVQERCDREGSPRCRFDIGNLN